MYNSTTHTYESTDASGSYDWITEGMQPSTCKHMTDEDIYQWVDTIIEQAKEDDIAEMEEWANRDGARYPTFGYDTGTVLENAEEYIEFKREEIESDYAKDREYVFKYLKEWIAGEDDEE